MTHAKRLWSIWQALLSAFAWAFTGPSFRRFAEWVTAMAINGEEHTITQSVLALERPADWKALESFAEYGAWHPDYVTASLTRLVETAPGRLWHGYHISAVDDTKVHRNSPDVWEPAPSTNIPPAESLTKPIVQYTLEPLVYEGPAEGKPKDQWRLKLAAELLALKICDMACGSGAFLVQVCIYLAERLLEAWEVAEKRVEGSPGSRPMARSRRDCPRSNSSPWTARSG